MQENTHGLNRINKGGKVETAVVLIIVISIGNVMVSSLFCLFCLFLFSSTFLLEKNGWTRDRQTMSVP